MSKVFDLASNLQSINKFYEVMMKKSIENYEEYIGYSAIMISNAIPSHEDSTVRRLLNRERCIALITMDTDQRHLAEHCTSERQHARKKAVESIAEARKQSQVEKSAWFYGDRTD